jgi:hypothetical protein
MSATVLDPAPAPAAAHRSLALVWIDSREAIVARWSAGTIEVERLRSDVPPHRRSTGHVRHDPTVRHGGGGAPQTAGEERRLEHLARFLAIVEAGLPEDADLILLGPGTVHERLAHQLGVRDAQRRVGRVVRCEVAPRMTRRQLIARLRTASGEPPRRRTVGAYRWTEALPQDAPRAALARRVAPKRPRSFVPPEEEVT